MNGLSRSGYSEDLPDGVSPPPPSQLVRRLLSQQQVNENGGKQIKHRETEEHNQGCLRAGSNGPRLPVQDATDVMGHPLADDHLQ